MTSLRTSAEGTPRLGAFPSSLRAVIVVQLAGAIVGSLVAAGLFTSRPQPVEA